MLKKLSAGDHKVTISFDDGSADAVLTILVPPGGYSPTTGDDSNTALWVSLMLLSAGWFAAAGLGSRKLRKPRYAGKH